MWDFRHLIRRGGGLWPRDWRGPGRRPLRPPGGSAEAGGRRREAGGRRREAGQQPPNADAERAGERWLEPTWQPPDSADTWKQ